MDTIAAMRQHPLPDMATPEQLTARMGVMTGKHNAYLGANKYTGIDLNRFMVRQLPVSLLQTREAILREMITNPSFGNDYSQVLERCCEVLEAVRTAAQNGQPTQVAVPALAAFGLRDRGDPLLSRSRCGSSRATTGRRQRGPRQQVGRH
eukprot:scaffold17675_cov107-Isochrysis_galbana.AAC.2